MKAIIPTIILCSVFFGGWFIGRQEVAGRYQLAFDVYDGGSGMKIDRKVDTATGRFWEKLQGVDHWSEMGIGTYDKPQK